MCLVFLTDHEAGDVLQKDERDFALRAKFNEMRALERRFRKQDSIIGEDAHGITEDVRESADEGRSIERLELVEHAAVDDAGNDFAHVISLARIGGDNAVYFLRVVKRFGGLSNRGAGVLRAIEGGDDLARAQQCVRVAQRIESNADRSSAEKSSGSSQAAKWPPLSTSLK